MTILGYNRKLAWAAIAAVIWALLGLSLALGISGPPGEQLRAGLRLGMPEDGVRLRGHVVSMVEEQDGLHLTLAAPRPLPPTPELPPRLFVETVVEPAPWRIKPELKLGADARTRELPGDRHIAVTADFILFYGHGDVRVIKRPPELTGDRLREWLRRHAAERRPPRMDQPPPDEPRPEPPRSGQQRRRMQPRPGE